MFFSPFSYSFSATGIAIISEIICNSLCQNGPRPIPISRTGNSNRPAIKPINLVL
nr:MAG TPA: hypothetical protein [Caudoviricetes sp.]